MRIHARPLLKWGVVAASLALIGSAPAATPRIPVTGTFQLRIILSVSTAIPAGTVINIYPDATVMDTTYSNDSFASTTAKVTAGKASVVVAIPYSWLVASTSDKVTISVSAFTSASNSTYSFSDSNYLSQTIALPANGKTTVVTFSGGI